MRTCHAARSVRLTYGAHDLLVALAGLSVAQARLAYQDVLNVPEHVESYVNGERSSFSAVLHPNDRLEFMREGGQKGGGMYKNEFMQHTGISESKWQELVAKGLRFGEFEGQVMIDDAEAEKWIRYLIGNGSGIAAVVQDPAGRASISLAGNYDDGRAFQITWDRTTGVIMFNEKRQTKPLSPMHIKWLDGLLRANGDWRPLASIIDANELESINPTRLRRSIPACIGKLIESEPGKGSRLRTEFLQQ